jgi:lysophospholipase L1-like esterase
MRKRIIIPAVLAILFFLATPILAATYNFGSPQTGGYPAGGSFMEFGSTGYHGHTWMALLRDTFPVALSSPNINATKVLTDQNRYVADSGLRASIANGIFSTTGGGGHGDPALVYSSSASAKVAFNRAQGLAFRFGLKPGFSSASLVQIGWDAGGSLTCDAGLAFNGSATTNMGAVLALPSISIPCGPLPNTTWCQYIIAQQTTGYYYLAYGSQYLRPTLLYVERAGTAAAMYPYVNDFSMPLSLNDAAVIDLTQFGAPWTTQDGLATNRISSPTNPQTTTMEKNAIVEVTWTPATGDSIDLNIRQTDADNRWILRCVPGTSGNVKLIKRKAGVETTLATVTLNPITVGTAYRLVFLAEDGNYAISVGAFPNAGVLTSIKWHITPNTGMDIFNLSATGVSVQITNGGTPGTLANLIAWPRFPNISPAAWAWNQKVDNLIFAGDSQMTWGTNTSQYILRNKVPFPHYDTIAISGEYASNLATSEAPQADALYKSSARNNWIILWAGTNDIWSGGAISTTGRTTANYLWAFCDARRAVGYKVLVVTMNPRGNHTTVYSPTWANKEQWRQNYNTIIRNEWTDHADLMVDAALYAETNWGTYPAENTTYIGDTVHCTAAGGAAIAQLIVDALNGYTD